MKIKNKLISLNKLLTTYTILICLLFSCNTPKYTYQFENGKHLNFNDGKWLLNNTKSNSKVFDAELYDQCKDQFKEIVGNHLVEINDVRQTKIIAPEISFNLTKQELIQLHKDSGCDFLINIKGNIIAENAGSLSLPSNDSNYYATNEASVSIKIYDLKTGQEFSSSKVYGKVIDQGSDFDNNNNYPIISTSAHTAMLRGAKKLIRKYKKYQVKQGGEN